MKEWYASAPWYASTTVFGDVVVLVDDHVQPDVVVARVPEHFGQLGGGAFALSSNDPRQFAASGFRIQQVRQHSVASTVRHGLTCTVVSRALVSA